MSTGPGGGARVRLLGKPGCHLCEDARAVVERVCTELGVGWVDDDITQDAQLWEAHHERIPVVFVDGREIAFWWVAEDRLRDALAAAEP